MDMMIKHTLTAAALAAVLALPAYAQAPQPTATVPSVHENFVQSQHATDWRGSKLIGAIVYGPDNASIGSVSDVLIGNDSTVRAVVIGVGGFLGVGEKNVAVPLDALNISRKPDSSAIDKITVSYSKDDLKKAPTFAFDDVKAQTTGSGVTDTIKGLSPISPAK
jgi:PRC-barrel domain